jgi:hypothetical protein
VLLEEKLRTGWGEVAKCDVEAFIAVIDDVRVVCELGFG